MESLAAEAVGLWDASRVPSSPEASIKSIALLVLPTLLPSRVRRNGRSYGDGHGKQNPLIQVIDPLVEVADLPVEEQVRRADTQHEPGSD